MIVNRVPLKTALKRENEIAALDARKADESGLVCRSAPLSRKLDTSPLPGRPRPVRRFDAVDGHGRKPWYCRQKRAGRAHTKRHKVDSSFSLKLVF